MRRWKPLAHLLARVTFGACVALALLAGPARAASLIANSPNERAPLTLNQKSGVAHSSTGGSIVRTVVGLAIVLAVIWGLAWVLKQLKKGKEERPHGGLRSLAALPLGSGRSVQLLKAGNDYLLVGVAEHSIQPLKRYSEAEARAAGLLELGPDNPLLSEGLASTAFAETELPLLERLRRWTVRR